MCFFCEVSCDFIGCLLGFCRLCLRVASGPFEILLFLESQSHPSQKNLELLKKPTKKSHCHIIPKGLS